MSAIRTNSVRRTGYDHFEPDASDDPQTQKRLRAHLEQLDYTAFAANREIVGQALGAVDTAHIQRLALAAANARAAWIRQAMTISEASHATPDQIERLYQARLAFEELAEAYEGLRRTIERGYLQLTAPPPR